jgi:hypothetical protein
VITLIGCESKLKKDMVVNAIAGVNVLPWETYTEKTII